MGGRVICIKKTMNLDFATGAAATVVVRGNEIWQNLCKVLPSPPTNVELLAANVAYEQQTAAIVAEKQTQYSRAMCTNTIE